MNIENARHDDMAPVSAEGWMMDHVAIEVVAELTRAGMFVNLSPDEGDFVRDVAASELRGGRLSSPLEVRFLVRGLYRVLVRVRNMFNGTPPDGMIGRSARSARIELLREELNASRSEAAATLPEAAARVRRAIASDLRRQQSNQVNIEPHIFHPDLNTEETEWVASEVEFHGNHVADGFLFGNLSILAGELAAALVVARRERVPPGDLIRWGQEQRRDAGVSGPHVAGMVEMADRINREQGRLSPAQAWDL